MDLHNHKSSAVRKLALTQIVRSIFSFIFIINFICDTCALSTEDDTMSINPVVISSSVKQTATVSVMISSNSSSHRSLINTLYYISNNLENYVQSLNIT